VKAASRRLFAGSVRAPARLVARTCCRCLLGRHAFAEGDVSGLLGGEGVRWMLRVRWPVLCCRAGRGGGRRALLGDCGRFVVGVGILKRLGARLSFGIVLGRRVAVHRVRNVVCRMLLGIGRSVGVGLRLRTR